MGLTRGGGGFGLIKWPSPSGLSQTPNTCQPDCTPSRQTLRVARGGELPFRWRHALKTNMAMVDHTRWRFRPGRHAPGITSRMSAGTGVPSGTSRADDGRHRRAPRETPCPCATGKGSAAGSPRGPGAFPSAVPMLPLASGCRCGRHRATGPPPIAGPPVRQRKEPSGISHHDPEVARCAVADGNQVERPGVALG